MNRNPGKPKVIAVCTCEVGRPECTCRPPDRSARYITLVTLAVSVLIMGLSYLFGG